eukprot:scaffold140388_cov22-Tisochrysis_lutea.AAC.1
MHHQSQLSAHTRRAGHAFIRHASWHTPTRQNMCIRGTTLSTRPQGRTCVHQARLLAHIRGAEHMH